MGLSNTYADILVRRAFQGAAFAVPTNLLIRLWTTKPGVDGTGGVEASGVAYSPQSLGPLLTNWPAVSGQPGQVANGAAIDFGTVGAGGWGHLIAVSVEDQDAVIIGTADIDETPSSGSTFDFPVGDLIIDLNPS